MVSQTRHVLFNIIPATNFECWRAGQFIDQFVFKFTFRRAIATEKKRCKLFFDPVVIEAEEMRKCCGSVALDWARSRLASSLHGIVEPYSAGRHTLYQCVFRCANGFIVGAVFVKQCVIQFLLFGINPFSGV